MSDATDDQVQASVLSTADVEYLFRSVNDLLTKAEVQLRSLSQHFLKSGDMPTANKIEIAVSNTITAGSHARIAKREAIKTTMPHRLNDGEDPAW